MVELVFVACLLDNVEKCDEHRLIFVDITPMVCLMAAQPELAKWIEAHPNKRIDSWKCRWTQYAEQDA